MNQQIIISGVGGQGVLFVTRLLAQACMAKGLHVLTSETHGMAQRGGTVISHLKIGNFKSPLIRPGNADLFVVLKTENFDQHKGFLKSDGVAVVNTSSPLQLPPPGTVISFDADTAAREDAAMGSVNLYMLGVALTATPLCSLEEINRQITERLAQRKPELAEKALACVARGYAGTKEG